MPIYKESGEGEHILIVSNHVQMWYTDEIPDPDGKMRVRFYRKEQNPRPGYIIKEELHRTDGPAVVTWSLYKKGITRLYYLNGKQCDPNIYLKVLNAPLKDLPLYLNHYPYSEIAKDRLSGSRTEIELKESSNLEPDIQKRIWVASPKQVLVQNLADIINAAAFRRIQNIKPFKVFT